MTKYETMATGVTAFDAKESDTRCGSCRNVGLERQAQFYCKTCSQHQCSKCVEVHDVYQYMFGHVIQRLGSGFSETVTGSDTDNAELLRVINKIEICDFHGKTLEIFCQEHNELCCATCAVDHLRCKHVKSVSKHVEEKAFDATRIQRKVKEVKVMVNRLKQNIQTQISKIDSKFDFVNHYTNIVKSSVNDVFPNLTSKISTNVDEKTKPTLSCINDRDAECQRISQALQTNCTRYMKIMKQGTVTDCFKAAITIRKYLMSQEPKLDIKAKMTVTDMIMTVTHTLRNYQLVRKQLLLVTRKASSLTGDLIYPMHLTRQTTVDLTASMNAKKTVVLSGIEILPDGRIVAIDGQNNQFLVMGSNAQDLLSTFSLDYEPFDLAVIAAGSWSTDVAIAYEGGFSSSPIIILSVRRNNDIVETARLKTYRMHDAVRVMDTNTLIAGPKCSRCSAEIVKISSAERLKFPVNLPEKDFKYGESTATLEYITSRKMLIIAHKLKDKLFFCDVTDKDTNPVEVVNACLKQPRGMCVGPMDCVYVCSYGTNKIMQFSPHGDFVCCYQIDSNPIYWPIAISISKDGSKMVVATNNNGETLATFSLNPFR